MGKMKELYIKTREESEGMARTALIDLLGTKNTMIAARDNEIRDLKAEVGRLKKLLAMKEEFENEVDHFDCDCPECKAKYEKAEASE